MTRVVLIKNDQMQKASVISIASIAFLLQSCSLTVPLIVFSGSTEVLKGSATGRMDGTGTVEFSSKELDVTCEGEFEYQRRGASGWGTGTASCSDGTTADFKFDAATSSKGYGAGEDSKGRPFMFAYGYKESVARKIYEKIAGSKLQLFGKELMPDPVSLQRGLATGDGENLKKILSSSVESTVKITAGPATGTGFVISSSKKIGSKMLVLTNNHVVRDEEVVGVRFSNGSEYLADVIGRSGEIDTALLKVENGPKTVAPFSFCYGQRPTLGENVVAIGNPLGQYGIGTTVTRGIISGVIGSGLDTQIITDAAINSGNSGGPLINYYGEVVGIATAKIKSIGVDNIAFAIPVEQAFNSLRISVDEYKSIHPKTECGNIISSN